MKLSELKVNEYAVIKEMNLDDKTKKRLIDMGVTKNSKLCLIRVAPFGSPLEIKIRDFYLALRLDDAQKIIVKKVNNIL